MMSFKTYFPALMNGLVGLLVVGGSFWSKDAVPIDKALAKPAGIILVLLGMGAVTWAGVYHKGGLTAAVTPKLDLIIKAGPYKFVRHPIYLGLVVALAGVSITLRSWLGLVCTLLLFLPAEVYRAKLEEKALSEKFGAEWESYCKQTGFFFPAIGRRKN